MGEERVFVSYLHGIIFLYNFVRLLNLNEVKLRYLIIIPGMLFSSALSYGQTDAGTTVVESIESSGHIRVNMPSQLKARLGSVQEKAQPSSVPAVVAEEQKETKPAVSHATGNMGGYRIQVFSDSNPSTAKAEARARARNINARFPQFGTYVVYSSPYWRLRVGNFRTHEEANAAAHELKDAFPSYSREIRVVKDRITINN